MDTLRSDLRYALRQLARSPLFTVVAISTLAIGIGANTALFSVVNAVLLRPLPYQDSDRILRVYSSWIDTDRTWLSEPELADYRERVPSFEAIAAWSAGSVNLTGDGEPERVTSASVTPDLFRVLGVQTGLGREFAADEGRPGAEPTVILSDGLFQRRFAGDPAVIGRAIQVNGAARVVVGVLTPEFRLPHEFEGRDQAGVLLPLVIDPVNPSGRGSHYLQAAGRLAPGATIERAQSELAQVGPALTAEGFYNPANNFQAQGFPLRDEIFGSARPALMVLMAAVVFVLLIACANVAHLLLARAEAREREVAVRTAVGAGRGRILRQLLTESLVLAFIAGIAGTALAIFGTRALLALDPASVPRSGGVSIDRTVLFFTLGVSILTGLLFGAGPAWHAARTDPQSALREGGRGGGGSRRRQILRRLMAATELGLAVVLVTGAALMVRTFAELRAVDLGFESEGVLTMRLSLPSTSYPDDASVVSFYERLILDVEANPAVQEAATIRVLPLAAQLGDWGIDIEGIEETAENRFQGDWQVASPGYVEALGLRMVEGRPLEDRDRADAPPVVIVNRTMADQYMGGNALGRRLRMNSEGEWFTVVGVFENVRHNAILEEARTEMIHPHAQYVRSVGFAPRTMSLVVKTAADPTTLVASVRAAVRLLDPQLPVSQIATMSEVVGDARSDTRFLTSLLSVLGVVALILAAVGIYGVSAFGVSLRSREIGIRMALGADRASVLGLVVQQGMAMAALGILGGVAAAALMTRTLSAFLYQVEALDPVTFVAVPLLLGLVSLVAVYIPARRASGIEPQATLRTD